MDIKRKYICKCFIALMLFLSCVVISDHISVVSVEAKTKKYTVSVYQIKKFKKSGSYLIVSAKEAFYGSKKKMKVKTNKKCKYIRVNHGNRTIEQVKIKKTIKYKEMKQDVDHAKNLPDNGYYWLDIYIKNKKVSKVVFNIL